LSIFYTTLVSFDNLDGLVKNLYAIVKKFLGVIGIGFIIVNERQIYGKYVLFIYNIFQLKATILILDKLNESKAMFASRLVNRYESYWTMK